MWFGEFLHGDDVQGRRVSGMQCFVLGQDLGQDVLLFISFLVIFIIFRLLTKSPQTLANTWIAANC